MKNDHLLHLRVTSIEPNSSILYCTREVNSSSRRMLTSLSSASFSLAKGRVIDKKGCFLGEERRVMCSVILVSLSWLRIGEDFLVCSEFSASKWEVLWQFRCVFAPDSWFCSDRKEADLYCFRMFLLIEFLLFTTMFSRFMLSLSAKGSLRVE